MGSKKTVLKTIGYAKKYGYKLAENEVFERLMSKTVFSKHEIDMQISAMNLKFVKKRNGEGKKLKIARKLARMIEKENEDILMVGVTGSVAAGSDKKSDDIDMVVITRNNRMWWCRLCLKWMLQKNKIPHRRWGEKEKPDYFCFNMWIEEGELKIPKRKQGLRSAVDLVLLKPLIDKENIYKRFIKMNGWAKKWVATPYRNIIIKTHDPELKVEKKRNIETKTWKTAINLIVFVIQYLYMWPKIKNEKVERRKAFFHGS